MALVINTNIASLNAQNNLNTSQSELDKALAQLSSGLKINSPADNPAGYAIAQGMSSQINGFNQAISNANDGISFAQVANGAMSTITNSLQSIRTLAVQSSNATNSAQDRQALNSQVQQAIAQINSIAQNTQFNGQSILNGNLSSLVFQVGANAGQTIQTQGLDVRGQNLGSNYGDGASINTSNLASASGTIQINNVAINLAGNNGSISNVVAAINNASSQTGVYAQRASQTQATIGYSNTGSGTISIDGVAINVANGANATSVADAINAYTTQTNVSATANIPSVTGSFTLTAKGTTQIDTIALKTAGTSGQITISGTGGSGTITIASGAASVANIVSDINAASGQTGVSAVASGTNILLTDATGTFTVTSGTGGSVTTGAGASGYAGGSFTINGTTVNYAASGSGQQAIVSGINAVSGTTGVSATVSGTNIVLTNSVGGGITVSGSSNTTESGTNVSATTGSTITLKDATGADITTSNTGGVTVTSGGTISAGIELYTSVGKGISIAGSSTTLSDIGLSGSTVSPLFNGSPSSLTSLTLNSTNVLTFNGAQTAIKAMDFALTQLSKLGGELGALQTRFQSTISNLQSSSQNTQAARSRIQDTNFASATAQLSRAQILQQAGVAMVAQANSLPQLALSLLK